MATPSPSIPTMLVPSVGPRPHKRAPAAMLKYLLTCVLALAPLPLASQRALAWSVLAITLGCLLLLAMLCEMIERTPSAQISPLRVPAGLALIIAVWIWMQSQPLQGAAEISHIWRAAARAMDSVVHPSISLDREESISHLLRLLAYGAAFLLAWRIGRVSEDAGWMIRALGMVCAVYALYGLIAYFSGSHTILWLTKWAYRDDLTGTFVNRNSFATFLGLGMLANLGWLAQVLARYVDNRSWRAHLESVSECLLRRGLWQTVGLVIIGSALLFTHSRGGTVSSILGVTVLVASALTVPSLRAPWRTSFVTLAVLGTTLMVVLDGGALLSRVADTSVETDLRLDINAGTLSAISKNYLLGTGLGTFKYVYAPYQPPSVGSRTDLAHDDYLENVLELGVPAGIAFYLMLLLLVLECLRGAFRRRRNAIFPCLGLSASVLVGCHSAVDFSMQAPAVATIYAVLLGVGVAQSQGSSDRAAREKSLQQTA